MTMLGTILFAGCAHTHLKMKTVHQSNTINNIFEKQVLDNLAMFCAEPNSIPSFAYPKEGNTNVNDSINVKATPWNAFREVFGVDGGRTSLAAWGLVPVTDPEKLHLMRCAYQRAVGFLVEDKCTNCCEREKSFIGKPEIKIAVTKVVDGKSKAVIDPKTNAPFIDPETGARATYANGTPVIDPETGLPKLHIRVPQHDCDGECAIQCGWLCQGRLKEVPLSCRHLVGSYHGTYVWVRPDGYDQFAKLVMSILDYATNDPAKTAAVQKQVRFYIDEKGQPVNQSKSVGEVTAVIDVGERNTSILAQNITMADLMAAQAKSDEAELRKAVFERIREILDNKNITEVTPKVMVDLGKTINGKQVLKDIVDLKNAERRSKLLEENAKFAPPAIRKLPKLRSETPSFGPSTLQQLRRLDAITGRVRDF